MEAKRTTKRRQAPSLAMDTANRPPVPPADDPFFYGWRYVPRAGRNGTEALDQATRRFAELMMDATVSSALHGETMDTADAKIGEGPAAPHPIAPADFR